MNDINEIQVKPWDKQISRSVLLDVANDYFTYLNYGYEFLMDDGTGFIGSKKIVNNQYSKTILAAHYRNYLKDNPRCKHKVFIVNESKHFTITQIKIVCK